MATADVPLAMLQSSADQNAAMSAQNYQNMGQHLAAGMMAYMAEMNFGAPAAPAPQAPPQAGPGFQNPAPGPPGPQANGSMGGFGGWPYGNGMFAAPAFGNGFLAPKYNEYGMMAGFEMIPYQSLNEYGYGDLDYNYEGYPEEEIYDEDFGDYEAPSEKYGFDAMSGIGSVASEDAGYSDYDYDYDDDGYSYDDE